MRNVKGRSAIAMSLEHVEIIVDVEDFEGKPRSFYITEFNYTPPIKTIIRGDPLDDQIGDPGGFEDVVCKWKDTGVNFTDDDWERYENTIYSALNDYIKTERDYDDDDS